VLATRFVGEAAPDPAASEEDADDAAVEELA
jgi:hypothetical protein